MTSEVHNSGSAPVQHEPPNLRPARFEDYSQIIKLEASHDMWTQSEQEWRAMWEANPLWERLKKNWPIGWVLEDSAGKIVGSIVNVPSAYRFGGRELLCANGRAWVCANEYRGFAVLLMDEYFNQEGAELFINTTVGPVATETLEQYASHVPLGDWNSIAFWITGYEGFARVALEKARVPARGLLTYPAAAALWVKDALWMKSLPAADQSVEIEWVDGFDDRFDPFWEELVRQNPDKLLAARDSRALAWHFALPLRQQRLWILTAKRKGLLRAYCIVKREDRDTALKRMRVVDFQSVERDCDLLPALLEAARRKCVAEGIHMLEHLGCGLPKMRSFDDFAPYRRPLGHWPFYYHAAKVELQKELANPAVWDPSSYDGDSSFE
jgi:hypothetical protein